MGTIRRGTIVNNFTDSLKTDVATGVPTQTSDKIVLTYDYNNVKTCDVVKAVNSAVTGSTLVYTTPADEDFYLTSAMMGIQEDATSDNVRTRVSITLPSGETATLCDVRKITTTATTLIVNKTFNPPIKLKRNTPINVSNAFTSGVAVKYAEITGFTTSG